MTLTFGAEKVEPKSIEDVFILSLGTGKMYKANEYTKQRGLLGWARPIADVFIRGDSQEVDYTLHDLSMAAGCPKNFVRINPFLGPPEAERLKAGGIKNIIQTKIEQAFPFVKGIQTRKEETESVTKKIQICKEEMDFVTNTNLDNLKALGDHCAEKVSSMLELKLPNCQEHKVKYDDVTLDYIAQLLIDNKATKKDVKERVVTWK